MVGHADGAGVVRVHAVHRGCARGFGTSLSRYVGARLARELLVQHVRRVRRRLGRVQIISFECLVELAKLGAQLGSCVAHCGRPCNGADRHISLVYPLHGAGRDDPRLQPHVQVVQVAVIYHVERGAHLAETGHRCQVGDDLISCGSHRRCCHVGRLDCIELTVGGVEHFVHRITID